MIRQGAGGWIADILFVLILPPVCFAMDPVVFHAWNGLPTPAYRAAFATYATIGGFMAIFFVLRLFGRRMGQRVRVALAGVVLAGFAVALAFGFALLPFTLAATMAIFGILGLAPFGTAWRYWTLFRQATGGGWPWRWLVAGAVGFAASVAILTILATATVERRIEALRGGGDDAAAALRALDANPFCGGHCVRAAFQALCPMGAGVFGERPDCPRDAETDAAFTALSGWTLVDYEERVFRATVD